MCLVARQLDLVGICIYIHMYPLVRRFFSVKCSVLQLQTVGGWIYVIYLVNRLPDNYIEHILAGVLHFRPDRGSSMLDPAFINSWTNCILPLRHANCRGVKRRGKYLRTHVFRLGFAPAWIKSFTIGRSSASTASRNRLSSSALADGPSISWKTQRFGFPWVFSHL